MRFLAHDAKAAMMIELPLLEILVGVCLAVVAALVLAFNHLEVTDEFPRPLDVLVWRTRGARRWLIAVQCAGTALIVAGVFVLLRG